MSKVDATINIKITNLGELNRLEKRLKKLQGQSNVNVGQSQEVKLLQQENNVLKERIELLKQENKLENRRNRGGFGRGGRRGRVLSSAAIGGGFPLLFGGGPLQALAGGIGGGLGELARPGGGFAGSIAATAVVSQIQKATDSVAKLGQAMNPLTMDVQKLTQSLGIAGTPAGQYLKVLEQTEGKQAAFNEAMKRLNSEIGTKGVTALKEFGQNVQTITNGLGEFFTKLAAGFAEAANKVAKPIAEQFETSSQLEKAQADLESSRQRIIASRGDQSRGGDGLGGATEYDRAILDFKNNIDRVRKLTKQLNQETKQDEDDLSNSRLKNLNDQMKGITDQNKFLQDQLTLGDQGARIEQEKLKFAKANNIQVSEISEKEKNRIENAIKLNDKLKDQKEVQEQITNILSTNMTSAVMGLIDGTKSLSQSLAGVARQLASLFLNRAFGSLFGGLFSEQGSYSRAGGFKAFQYGGVVNSPTLGMVGEGGEPEYIIPSSKMDGAMARYSAGARGGAVIPGGSHEAGTVAGASGSTVVEYTGPVLNFNGDDYVPKDAVPRIISTAAQQGASMGQSKMMSTLKNSRSQRSKIGI